MLLIGSCGLKGMGHFTIWFLLGLIAFIAYFSLSKKPIQSKMGIYGPFLPFVLGALATLPYFIQILGLLEKELFLNPLSNLWFFHPFLDQSQFVCRCFSNFYLNILILAICYAVLIVHYIRLIKCVRKDLSKSRIN